MKRLIFLALLCLAPCAWSADSAMKLTSSPAGTTLTVQATSWHGERALKIPMAFTAAEWKKAGFGAVSAQDSVELGWLFVTVNAYQLQSVTGTVLMGGPRADLELDKSHCIRMRSISSSVCGSFAAADDVKDGTQGTNEAHMFLRLVAHDFSAAYKEVADASRPVDFPVRPVAERPALPIIPLLARTESADRATVVISAAQAIVPNPRTRAVQTEIAIVGPPVAAADAPRTAVEPVPMPTAAMISPPPVVSTASVISNASEISTASVISKPVAVTSEAAALVSKAVTLPEPLPAVNPALAIKASAARYEGILSTLPARQPDAGLAIAKSASYNLAVPSLEFARLAPPPAPVVSTPAAFVSTPVDPSVVAKSFSPAPPVPLPVPAVDPTVAIKASAARYEGVLATLPAHEPEAGFGAMKSASLNVAPSSLEFAKINEPATPTPLPPAMKTVPLQPSLAVAVPAFSGFRVVDPTVANSEVAGAAVNPRVVNAGAFTSTVPVAVEVVTGTVRDTQAFNAVTTINETRIGRPVQDVSDDLTPVGAPRGVKQQSASDIQAESAAAVVAQQRSQTTLLQAEQAANFDHARERELASSVSIAQLPGATMPTAIPTERQRHAPRLTNATVFGEQTRDVAALPARRTAASAKPANRSFRETATGQANSQIARPAVKTAVLPELVSAE